MGTSRLFCGVEPSEMTLNSIKMHAFQERLAALGATACLALREARVLDEQGYIILEGIVPQARLDDLRHTFERALNDGHAQTPSAKGQTGTRSSAGLLNESEFRRVGLEPRLLAAAFHVLKRRFLLTDIHARDPLPGFGQQGLHADWHSTPINKSFAVVTALCLFDDFTRDNGATRVVPGTHRFTGRCGKSIADPQYVHPKQVVVQAKAGSMMIFNGHLWHSGTRNRSQCSRRTLQISFRAFEYCDLNSLAAPLDLAVLSSAERYLLGFDS